jgi:hypothetical protein
MEAFKEEDKKTRFFLELTKQLKDHRRVNTGNIRHPMHEILFLTLPSVVSGCKTWEEVEEFGNLKID